MKDKLILFDTAKLAKEKGFDWKVLKAYDGVPICSHSESIFKPLNYNSTTSGNYHSAPTQSLLQKWLREEHNIHIGIDYGELCKKYMLYIHFVNNEIESDFECIYKTYEEALELGLQEALKSIHAE